MAVTQRLSNKDMSDPHGITKRELHLVHLLACTYVCVCVCVVLEDVRGATLGCIGLTTSCDASISFQSPRCSASDPAPC